MNPFTLKICSFYVAYAPDVHVSAFGVCREDALNNLVDQIRDHSASKKKTADERKRDVFQ
jgi:hypothetical protein